MRSPACQVTCTWWLLGLAVKESWSVPGFGIGWVTPCPEYRAGLQNNSHFRRLISGKEDCLGSEWVYDNQEC